MPTLEEIEAQFKAKVPAIRIGQLVRYFDASGNTKAALITAIRDAGAGKVRLSVFEPGATLTDADNIVWSAQSKASSWQAFDSSVDRLS